MMAACIVPFHNPGAYFRPAIGSVVDQDVQPDNTLDALGALSASRRKSR